MTGATATDTKELLQEPWDVIVVGTGMGGATIGHALAKAGKRVLFCERGRSHLQSAEALVGCYPEQDPSCHNSILTAESSRLLQNAGRYAHEVVDISNERHLKFMPFIGSGTGGSSALYGMALERFHPEDFKPLANHPGAVGSSLDHSWPIDYETLAPFYAMAESLYRVKGTRDPLRTDAEGGAAMPAPPPLTRQAGDLSGFLEGKGLHPYRLPLACDYVAGCQCCQGFLCSLECKNDGSKICLEPALRHHGAVLLDECEVLRVVADRTRVTGLACSRRGEPINLRAKVIILAAGALQTPNLLLRSTSGHWPQGLANGNGLVGRNLMRHFIDLYLIRPDHRQGAEPFDNRFKELAFNDFYMSDGAKLGSVQSFGRLPPKEMLVASMQQDLRDSPLPWLAPLFPMARPFLTPVLGKLVNESLILATTLEDLPYPDNRVTAMQDQAVPSATVRINYTLQPEALERIEKFRTIMRGVLNPLRWRMIKQAENNQRIAHACGTCRFGTNPNTSVLDLNNRAHDLENLYVVDGSFFPSSGGTNPGLTIAANALRVAAVIDQNLGHA